MGPRTAPEPTNVEHLVGDADYFFSTTDRKGVIELANSVFVRLSRYSHDDLSGAPHNIIRHPDMPGGAFKLVWDQLEAGKPACAYVKNMAADGGTYWVFATLLPVGDKYLSVRMKPLVRPLKQASEQLYASVRPQELDARENEGASRDDAAALGLGLLAEGLATLDIHGPDDLAMVSLPQEVAAHEKAAPLPQRPEATGPYADLLAVMHTIDRDTSAMVQQLDEYDALVASLEASAADAGPASDRLARIAEAVQSSSGIDGQPEMLPDFTGRIDEKVSSAVNKLADLDGSLTELAAQVRSLRMRIALLRLHNRMVGTFCAELIDGEVSFDATASLQLLTHALADGATELEASMNEVRVALSAVPEQVQDAVRDADRTLRLSTKWRGESEMAEGDVAAALAPIVETLEQNSATGFDELARFYDVAARCQFLPDNYDDTALATQVHEMSTVVEHLRNHDAA